MQLPERRLGRTCAAAGLAALAVLAAPGLAEGAEVAAAPAGGGSTGLVLSAGVPVVKDLSAAGVQVAAVRPATGAGDRWSLPVTTPASVRAATLEHRGALRLTAGRRSLTLRALRLRTSPALVLDAAVGGRRLVLFRVTPAKDAPLRRDPAAGTIRLAAASVALTPAGASALRRALALRRLSGGRIGTLTLSARVAAATASGPPATSAAPAPAAPAAAPPADTPTAPGPSAPPDPDTDPNRCWSGRPATPATAADWIACALPGGAGIGLGSLRSWDNYVRTLAAGSVLAEAGATFVEDPYDVRLPAAAPAVEPDGTVLLQLAGRVRYRSALHGFDIKVENLLLRVTPGRRWATITAHATYQSRTVPGTTVEADLAIVGLDLAQAVRTVALPGGAVRLEAVPASLTAAGQEVWGPDYPVGAPWGAFTFTLPAP